jgi:hypothetical protein
METTISAEVEPVENQAQRAALALQELGFRVLHIGITISVRGPQVLWESLFNVSFEPERKRVLEEVEGGEVPYQKALVEHMRLPPELEGLVVDVMFAEPPALMQASG